MKKKKAKGREKPPAVISLWRKAYNKVYKTSHLQYNQSL